MIDVESIAFFEHLFGTTFNVSVHTNSHECCVHSVLNGELVIRLRNKPIDGKANQELITLLGDYLNIPKSIIEIMLGEKSKKKVILIKDTSIIELKSLFLVCTS